MPRVWIWPGDVSHDVITCMCARGCSTTRATLTQIPCTSTTVVLLIFRRVLWHVSNVYPRQRKLHVHRPTICIKRAINLQINNKIDNKERPDQSIYQRLFRFRV
jgi:hypothetical protein